MRLGKIRVNGFRKLVESECTTPGKLIAFVGPNEAGKSSLLQALLTLEDDEEDAIALGDRPRATSVSDDASAVECWFRLSPDDVNDVKAFGSPVTPIWYVVSKAYGGQLSHRMEPRLPRDLSSRRAAEQVLRRFVGTRAASALKRAETDDDDAQLGDHLDGTLNMIEGSGASSADEHEIVRALIAGLRDQGSRGLGAQAAARLDEWLRDAEGKPPESLATALMWRRRPRFVLFGPQARTLKSDYDLNAVADEPPAALRNLALVARLDLPALRDAVARQDSGAYVTATEEANARLRDVFTEAWQQSPVVVRLHLDSILLRVMVSNVAGGYSSIAERSDGLKAFVALTAFAAQETDSGRPLILLIDEAEQHLHFDAQADLIRMLERQGLAMQVLYTTHSPGCLPADLGTGIRPVIPADDGGRSSVSSSFWTGGRGFYPLLLALGAGAAAFAPSRYAVLSEGPSDMLLLPSMIREALDVQRLDYQVAPGIAESNWAQLLDLELEAARVAYLVDGDSGGEAHTDRLQQAGVEDERIVRLGGANSGLTLEDLLSEDAYLAAVNETLERVFGPDAGAVRASDLSSNSRGTAVDRWCTARGLPKLSKTVVASMLLERGPTALLPVSSRRILVRVHRELCEALGLPI